MNIGMLLTIVLVFLLVGIIPAWPHSRSWGYAPSGLVSVIVIVVVVLLLTGRL